MKSAVARDLGSWWWVRVHESQEELIAAANRMNAQRQVSAREPEGALALFQPSALHYYIDAAGKLSRPQPEGYVGTMRFFSGGLSSEIVTHESLHCAMAIYRRRFEEEATFGMDCGPREENLAHIVGRVSQTMVNVMYDLEEWA